ncbi:protein kinase [Streptomyces sp. NPDC086081]|uniref:serine/threonine-protein kinase n=1 Tax=Streptomyces sp. NPDC086081 TaxID=3365749 RepID=UPI0038263EEC
MGRVWRAADEILDRQVAVKEMRIDGLDAEDSRTRRERTLREARATARIDHPNVVRIYDVVDEGERLWIVMELVAGRSLERVLAEEGPLGPCETARIGLGLVAALRQVHERGVLHRDIKPGNVLVANAGPRAGSTRPATGAPAVRSRSHARRVVLTDFGIAAIQDAKALTMVGMLVGSPDYMAPERVSGRPQGPPSDIWSLGATLCAALGGRSPFSRDTTLATLHAVLYEEPELPAAAGPLREILTALLEKDPSTRPTLEDLETALEPVAFPEPTPTVAVGLGVGTGAPGEGATEAGEHTRLPPSETGPDPKATPGVGTAPGSETGPGVETARGPETAPGPSPMSRQSAGPSPGPVPGWGSGAVPGWGSGVVPERPTPAPPPTPQDSRPSPPADPRRLAPATLPAPHPGPDHPDPVTAPAKATAQAQPSSLPVPTRSPDPPPSETAGPSEGHTAAARPPTPSPVSLIRAHAKTEHRPHPRPKPRSTPMPPAELPGPPTPGRGTPTPATTTPATPTPATTAPTAPAPRPAARRHRTLLTIAAAVATAGTVVGILLATASTPPDGAPTRADSTATATRTASPTPAPTVEGTARPQSLPPGTHREAGGFAWATPDGWRRDVKTGAEVHYTSPDGSQELVGKSSLARGSLLETWQTSERNARQGEDYRKIRLEETTFRGHPAVVWEYTFTLRGVHWHARLLGFTVKGKSYQVNTWYDAAAEQEALRVYDKVKDSFTVL